MVVLVTRIVKAEAQGPEEVNGAWICKCGLSKNQPHCDGSHKKTSGEEAGKLYYYKEDGTRVEVKEECLQ